MILYTHEILQMLNDNWNALAETADRIDDMAKGAVRRKADEDYDLYEEIWECVDEAINSLEEAQGLLYSQGTMNV